jgi:feruloyl esterase
MAKLSLPDTTITSATLVTGASPVPEYCRVLGVLEGTIHFEVALPTTRWNGKFFYAGGGGFNGTTPSLTQGLTHGYASASSDTGHVGRYTDSSSSRSTDASWALDNPQAQINYGYRATHLVTVLAKEIVREYYGEAARRAYWSGCSNGGKMGLMEMQRYPEDFDGVIIGCFVIDRTKLMLSYAWTAQALAPAPIPPDRIPLIARATLAACDAQDGLVDGVVDSPHRCDFDPRTLLCGTDDDECLSPGQVEALEKIYGGAKNSAGELLFPGFPPGHEEDWARYITGEGTRNSYRASSWQWQYNFMRYFVFGTDYDPVKEFDFDTTPAKLKEVAKSQDAADPDLSAFQAHGGKLIMYHGWADHSITALRTLQYYDDVRKTVGEDATDEFARLFMVPGLHHCGRGPGPWSFGGTGQIALKDDAEHNMLMALDRWVEEGVAPEKIIGVKFVNDDPRQGVALTRPLCPYPQAAQYKGSGSINEAANFVCAEPR